MERFLFKASRSSLFWSQELLWWSSPWSKKAGFATTITIKKEQRQSSSPRFYTRYLPIGTRADWRKLCLWAEQLGLYDVWLLIYHRLEILKAHSSVHTSFYVSLLLWSQLYLWICDTYSKSVLWRERILWVGIHKRLRYKSWQLSLRSSSHR